MKRKIVTDITFLKQKSEEILFQGIEPCEASKHPFFKDRILANKGLWKLFTDLEDSLSVTKGIGLSAVQIGILKKVAIIRLPSCKLNLFNPKIIKKENKFRFPNEGCLSLPGLTIDTLRYNNIVIENGNGKRYSLEGLEAVSCLHEIDHMNGRLIIDAKWRKR